MGALPGTLPDPLLLRVSQCPIQEPPMAPTGPLHLAPAPQAQVNSWIALASSHLVNLRAAGLCQVSDTAATRPLAAPIPEDLETGQGFQGHSLPCRPGPILTEGSGTEPNLQFNENF